MNIEQAYEQSVATPPLIAEMFGIGIERPQVDYSKRGAVKQRFYDAVEDKLNEGIATSGEYADLVQADVIIRGRGKHAVVEASLAPEPADVEKAVRRAGIWERVTGEMTLAVVATPEPHPIFVQAAERAGVQVVAIPE